MDTLYSVNAGLAKVLTASVSVTYEDGLAFYVSTDNLLTTSDELSSTLNMSRSETLKLLIHTLAMLNVDIDQWAIYPTEDAPMGDRRQRKVLVVPKEMAMAIVAMKEVKVAFALSVIALKNDLVIDAQVNLVNARDALHACTHNNLAALPDFVDILKYSGENV